MAIENYYIPCTRRALTESLSSTKRVVQSWTDTTINGYIGSGNDTHVIIADKDTIESRYKFYCDDFGLNIYDRIVYETLVYEVITEPKNTTHRNHHVKTLLRKVNEIKQ